MQYGFSLLFVPGHKSERLQSSTDFFSHQWGGCISAAVPSTDSQVLHKQSLTAGLLEISVPSSIRYADHVFIIQTRCLCRYAEAFMLMRTKPTRSKLSPSFM